MNKDKKFSMVRTGTRGEYEHYAVLPCGVKNDNQQTELRSHYDKDTTSIFSSTDDVETETVKVGGRSYEMVLWGPNNTTPYENQELIEKNMVMSQCQNFNIMSCYGQGVRFLDRETKKMTEDKDIRSFCLRNAIHSLWMRMAIDMKFHYFSVLVIHLSRDHKNVVMMRTRNACDCRFTKVNEYGAIEYVLVSDWREGRSTHENVEAIPLLDQWDPLSDLKWRIGEEPNMYTGEKRRKPKDGECCKFAILCVMPTPGYQYYPVPYYFSIYRDAWYDIYRLIGIGKRFMIKNTSAPRIQVEVHRTYWDNVCREEGITDPVKRKKRILKERQDILDFCTKPENAGKAWVTSYDTTPEGKEKRMVRIYNLNEGTKKEGGDWSDDMQEASNSLCFAMGVHPNMVGAVPGKSQMNNSGSDKRELFTLKQAIEKSFHDVMEVPFHVVSYYNGWADKYTLDVPIIQLTTIDENKDAKETTVNTPDNGNNQPDNN